jgi:hypothetical protein
VALTNLGNLDLSSYSDYAQQGDEAAGDRACRRAKTRLEEAQGIHDRHDDSRPANARAFLALSLGRANIYCGDAVAGSQALLHSLELASEPQDDGSISTTAATMSQIVSREVKASLLRSFHRSFLLLMLLPSSCAPSFLPSSNAPSLLQCSFIASLS